MNNNSITAEKLALAKILLRNFGALHDFHVTQLEKYPIACMNISLDGIAEIMPKEKKVKFTILTKRYYYKKGSMTIKRDKYSPVGLILVPSGKYEREKQLAIANLKSWTSELLWGSDTNIEVEFDVEF